MFQNKNQSAVLGNDIFKGLGKKFPFKYNIKNFKEFKEGDVIFRAGEQSDIVYLIIGGEVKVKFPGMFGNSQLFQRSPKQFFGEKEVLDNIPRKSYSVAITDCLLYILKKSDFAYLLQNNDQLKTNLLNLAKDEKENNSNKKEIIFSDSAEQITDLPFFKKDRVEVNSEKYYEEIMENKSAVIPTPNIPDIIEVPEIEKDNKTEIVPEIKPSAEPIEPDPYDYTIKTETNIIPDIENNSDISESSRESFGSAFGEDSLNEVPFGRDSLNDPDDSESLKFPELEKYKNDKESFQNWDLMGKHDEELQASAISEDIYIDILLCIEKIGSSLVLNHLFTNIPSAVCQLISASVGTLYIHDEGKREFYTIEASGIEQRIKNTEGLPGLCYINQEIINLNDDPMEGERNIILFPVENKKGNIVSILQLNNSSKGFFDEKDKKIIKAIIPFIADSIENTLWFNKGISAERFKSLGIISTFLLNDFKRPLLMIKHYSEFLKQKYPDAEAQKILSLISDQSGIIADLVETTKEFSDNKIILKREESEVTLLMDDYLTLLAEYTDSRNVKVFRKYESHASVNVDRKKLFHAFYQIVKNACDAMPHGGNIFFLVKRADSSIEIQIKDEGKGIPLGIQDKVFDPFVTFDKNNSAGLGLTLARSIIQQHDGSVDFITDSDTGSTFSISLPAADLT